MQQVIDNKIIKVDHDDIKAIKQALTLEPAIFVAEIDGVHIQSLEDYILAIRKKFCFPPSYCMDAIDNINGFLDWMRDLDWLHDKRGYVLIIYNFNFFMQNNAKLKKEIIREFSETILPFWQEDVKRVVVGGKPKSFLVYLVD